jgi:Poly A polymerase head domain
VWSVHSLDAVAEIFGAEAAWVVGGAVRDELLGRPNLDLDVSCRDPQRAARELRARVGEAVFPLNERFGAWRVVLKGTGDRSARPVPLCAHQYRTVDFSPLRGDSIEADLAERDFTANAIALPVAGGDYVDPFGGREDVERRVLRLVSERAFDDDPLRLLRGVRLEEELGFRLDPVAEQLTRSRADLVTRAAGERILDELQRLGPEGIERLGELGLLEPLGGRVDARLRAFDSPWFRLTVTFDENLRRLPIPGDLRRFTDILLRAEPPADGSPRAIHRFRRATEPYALETLAYLGATDLVGSVEHSRATDPAEPLLRGDELGIPPGPEVGRLLELIAEERAAGTITTKEEALELVRRSLE